jgi:hypothetical protein
VHVGAFNVVVVGVDTFCYLYDDGVSVFRAGTQRGS